MNTRITLIIALLVFGFLFYDNVLGTGETSLFLARKFVDLVDWIAFWR
ncbi:hypothetical protein [Pseudooceanicola algae]|uniref:Glyceraldehyde-3-phosphate dehydrogenase n=1 Tax=Pseudooceanicola algae TaxID=1537215 RepID=A0A418SFK0_9RHOB|nr:hypothetical protein [Pseudooceanicola algae]QPM89872.1 hypothetical protein PSAL_011010 [Pseudooceanicola algae]